MGTRFANVVDATYDIASFLSDRVANFDCLDDEGARVLDQTIKHYRATGEWRWLPKVPDDVIRRREEEEAHRKEVDEKQKRARMIQEREAEVRNNPLNKYAWGGLSLLYYQEGRYKDQEQAVKRGIELNAKQLGLQSAIPHEELGRLYLAALSNHVRSRGIAVWGNKLCDVTAESLGYSFEELQRLAQHELREALRLRQQSGTKGERIERIEVALMAATELSSEAFAAYDRWQAAGG